MDDPQRQLSDVWLDSAELGGIAHEPQVRQLLGDALEHDAALEAAKGCAQTEVDAVAEGDVAVGVGAANVEHVGVVEDVRVTVRPERRQVHLLERRDRPVSEAQPPERETRRQDLDGSVEAQDLLDRGCGQ